MVRNNVLKKIYDRLSDSNIKYVCVGDVFYKKSSQVGDIDLLVAYEHIKLVEVIVNSVLEDQSVLIFFRTERPSPTGIDIKFIAGEPSGKSPSIQIDIFCCYHWRGFDFFNYNTARDFSYNNDGIFNLSSDITSYVCGFKDIIYGKSVKASRLQGGFSEESVIWLYKSLGFSECLLKNLLRFKNSRILRPMIFLTFWFRTTNLNKIFGFWIYLSRLVIFMIFRKRREVMLTFSGPDGSGKSSLINGLLATPLLSDVFEEIIVKHTRPHYLPSLSNFLIRKSDTRDVEARSVVPVSYLKALIHIFYYGFDYLIQRVLKVFPKFSRSYTLHIYDRYVYEYGYQQTFSKLPKSFFSWLEFCSKRPSLNYFLFADPHIIAERKTELNLHAIEYQISRFRSLNKNRKLNAVFLDSGKYNVPTLIDRVCADLKGKI